MYFRNKLITATLIVGAFCQVARGQCYCGENNGCPCNCNSPMVCSIRSGPGRFSGKYPECHELEPTGDARSCHNPILAPVLQKLPSCNCEPSCSSVSKSCPQVPMTYRQNPPYHPVDYLGPPYPPKSPELYLPEYLGKQSPPITSYCSTSASVPADPVSLALAYNNAKKGYNVREEKLNFGAIRKPVEREVAETVCNVPEDGLFALKNHIVELRPSCRKLASAAEEAVLSYFDDEDDCACDCDEGPNYPTYQELGYLPECPACSKFQSAGSPPSQLPAPPTCQSPGIIAGTHSYQRNEDCGSNKSVRSSLLRRFSPRFGNCDY